MVLRYSQYTHNSKHLSENCYRLYTSHFNHTLPRVGRSPFFQEPSRGEKHTILLFLSWYLSPLPLHAGREAHSQSYKQFLDSVYRDNYDSLPSLITGYTTWTCIHTKITSRYSGSLPHNILLLVSLPPIAEGKNRFSSAEKVTVVRARCGHPTLQGAHELSQRIFEPLLKKLAHEV